MYAQRLMDDYARISAPRSRPAELATPRTRPRPIPGRRLLPKLLVTVVVVLVLVLVFARVAQGALTPPGQTVTVQPGDTLWSIAAAHYPGDDPRERVRDIEQLNHLDSPAVQAGTRLVLPAS
jgi:Tfp pilus assembly protein FimV